MLYRAAIISCIFLISSSRGWADQHRLIVLDSIGYQDQEYHLSYFRKHRRSPIFEIFEEEQQAYVDVVGGLEADVVFLCSASLKKWADADLIKPWDQDRVKRRGFGSHKIDLPQSAADLASLIVPFVFGRTLPIYNSSVVPEADVSGLDVFIDPNYSGQFAVPAEPIELFTLALLATGVDDWGDLSNAQFANAAEWLRVLHTNKPDYWTDYETLAEQLGRGEVIIAWAWNEVGFLAQGFNRDIRFVNEPVEGTSAWACGYSDLSNEAGKQDLRFDFVNARSSADTIDILLRWGEGHHDPNVMRQRLSEAEIRSRGLALSNAPILFQSPLPAAMLEKIESEVRTIISGS